MTGLRQGPSAIAVYFALLVGVALWIVMANVVHRPDMAGRAGPIFWLIVVALWLQSWYANSQLAARESASPWLRRLDGLLVPGVFGVVLIFLWEVVATGFGIPLVLLPAPSAIWLKLVSSVPILAADFVQTILRAVIPGWILGSLAGFLAAILCDRVPFLKRGLLPLGNFVAALPIVGVAPILVMWFGFDWPSKAAMVVVMTFFPMLVNAVTGLEAAGRLERDLLWSYGASWWQTLVKLRLPAALPFIFNALKINSTLALIGAIVAEFFGTPIVGMGFRISTEVGKLGLDMVWAEIAVAALTGSVFYGLITLIERWATFWHPSYRASR